MHFRVKSTIYLIVARTAKSRLVSCTEKNSSSTLADITNCSHYSYFLFLSDFWNTRNSISISLSTNKYWCLNQVQELQINKLFPRFIVDIIDIHTYKYVYVSLYIETGGQEKEEKGGANFRWWRGRGGMGSRRRRRRRRSTEL